MTPDQLQMQHIQESFVDDPLRAAERATSVAAKWLTFVYGMGLDIERGMVPCPLELPRERACDTLIHMTHLKTEAHLMSIEDNE
jgi:hypothetical protein